MPFSMSTTQKFTFANKLLGRDAGATGGGSLEKGTYSDYDIIVMSQF